MRLLDLFCGAGGCAKGYHDAGFEVVGIDINPQPKYPYYFIQDDVMNLWEDSYSMAVFIENFDAIHASPPCQAYSVASALHRNQGKVYPDLVAKTRTLLQSTGKPYVIENVVGAPLYNDRTIMLCGTMFGLGVFQHRLFEANFPINAPDHYKHEGMLGDGEYFSVAGGAGRWKSWGKVHRNISKGTAKEWRKAMGIDWMTRKELTQAIPPAYTKYIGERLIKFIKSKLNAPIQLALDLEVR